MPFSKNDPNINRKGRPKGISITEMVRAALDEEDGKSGEKWKDLIVKKILSKAVKDGDQNMIKAVWNYIDGMPKQSVEMDATIRNYEDLTDEELEEIIKQKTGEAGID